MNITSAALLEALKDSNIRVSISLSFNEAQKKPTVKDPITDFMNDQGFSPKGDHMIDVENGTVYENYQKWCVANGIKSPKTNVHFGRALTLLGYEKKRTNKARLITVHSETR